MAQPKSQSLAIQRIISQLDSTKPYTTFEVRRLQQQIDEILKANASAGYMLHGMLSTLLFKHDDTVDFFTKSLRLTPKDPVVNFNYALCLERLCKHEQAFEQFNKLVYIDVGSQDVIDSLALHTMLTGRFTEFFKSIDFFLKAVPEPHIDICNAIDRVKNFQRISQELDITEDELRETFKHVEEVLSSRQIRLTATRQLSTSFEGFKYLHIDLEADLTADALNQAYEEILDSRLSSESYISVEKIVVDLRSTPQ